MIQICLRNIILYIINLFIPKVSLPKQHFSWNVIIISVVTSVTSTQVTDVTTTSPLLRCRWCAHYTFHSNSIVSFDNKPPTTCQLVHYVCRRLRSFTTSDRCKQISNMLKPRAGAVSSWLRREIATHLAHPALPRCNRRSTGALRLRRKWEYRFATSSSLRRAHRPAQLSTTAANEPL